MCSLCFEGTYLFNNQCILNQIVYYYQNEQVCGDQIIQKGEVCVDGNQIEYDGCFQCISSCNQYSLNCEFGTCLSCQQGFVLNMQICEPFCGDGLVMAFTMEECDDNNQFEGCNQCKFECVPNCERCNSYTVHCFQCQKGFNNQKEICAPICGDGILIEEYEECDYKNKIMYDGCFNCKYQCSENCLKCDKGNCLLSCSLNRIVIDGSCLQYCGQKLISYEKECDDGNDIDYDGCYECKYKCPLYCSQCEKGISKKCQIRYSLMNEQCQEVETENEFVSLLGNQEISWIFKDQECIFSKSPQLLLIYQGIIIDQYQITIKFDQEVQCEYTKYEDIFDIYFKEMESDQYKVQCNSYQDFAFSNQTKEVQYQVKIKLLNPIEIKPTIIFEPLHEIINSNNQSINLIKYDMILDMPLILEQTQKERSTQIQLTSKAIVIIQCLQVFFHQSLDNLILLWNYLFINQEYPNNLLIYFQASEMIQVGPYLQIFNIDQFLNPYLEKAEFIQLEGKFAYYELETSLLTNICPQIFQAFGIVLFMFSGQILNKIFGKLMSNQQFTSFISNTNNLYSTVAFKIVRWIRKGIKVLQKQKYQFSFRQIILLLNSWDLLFKSILYLNFNKYLNIRNKIEFSLGLLIITTFLAILIDSFKFFRPNKLIKENQRFDQIFMTLELFRTFFFSIVLIIVQENQVLQTLLLFIGSFAQCYFIYKFKQVDKFNKILSILIEGTISIFILYSIIYFQNIREYINQDILITVGFFHIGLLLISSIILGLQQTILTIQLFLRRFMETKTN